MLKLVDHFHGRGLYRSIFLRYFTGFLRRLEMDIGMFLNHMLVTIVFNCLFF